MSDTTTEAPRTPVKYEVLEKSLVGNEVHEAGAIVSYAGLPAENLKPTCAVGEARYQEYLDTNKARIAKMQAENPVSGVGDPDAFAKALSKAMAENQATQTEVIAQAVAAAVAKAFASFMPKGKKAADAPPADSLA